ncbi:MAG: glycosyltransferase family 2 protein [Patescibacteria group bacterium]|nr:glycosyltransferase family 2 protein [Patescibacteria group bacterium]
MDISIVIVSWKVKEKLRANLAALLPSIANLRAEVIIVDNNSLDGSVEMVTTEFPEVKIIVNKDNRGFAKANNQALAIAQGNYVLLLNPDMLVFPHTIERLLAWADDNAQASVVGCRLEGANGSLLPHIRRFPRLADQLAIVLKLPHIFSGITDAYLCKQFDYSCAQKVDSIRGACFLINRQACAKIMPITDIHLDERYFIWFEEVDFCRQVYKNGGEVWYTPITSCVDYVGQSFNQVDVNNKQQYFQESMLKYFEKWQPRWQYYILKNVWPFGRLLAKIFS